MQRIAKQIYRTILDAKHILLIPHQHPDGDALGSVAAFMQFLRRIDKPHMAFCHTPVTERQTYLPHTDYIVSDPDIWRKELFDVIVVFDSGDLRYAGVADYIERLPKKPIIVNIDHHISNEHYGDHNLVSHTASSTSEMLYLFFTHNNILIDADTATCLLTGLMYDTDSFTNGATSETALRIGSELIRRGAAIDFVRRSLFQDKSIGTLRVWGLVLSRLQKYEPLHIVYTYVTQEDLQKQGVQEKDYEGIANFLNSLGEGKVALFLKEQTNGKYKCSFRTTGEEIDVAAWAGHLGGGGHKKSAGFMVEGPIDHALKYIFRAIENRDKKREDRENQKIEIGN